MARSKPHRRHSSRRTRPVNRQPLAPKAAGASQRLPRNRPDQTSAGRQHGSPSAATEPELTTAEAPAEPELVSEPEPELVSEPEPELVSGPEPVELPEPEVPAARRSEPSVAAREVPDERVSALLGEISELRLSAATHLTVAAAAMDAGRPDIAAELIEAQQRDVARLRTRAEELLGVEGETAEQARSSVAHAAALEESALLATARTPATKSLRRTPRRADVAVLPRRAESSRAPLWSATGALLAIAVALIVGVVQPLAPHNSTPSPDEISASVVASLDANVTRSYDELRETAKPKTPRMDVEEATARLHADLQRLLPLAATDPDAARRVLDVLKAERKLLADHAPAALAAYLPQAARIVMQLRALASPRVLAILPPVDAIIPQSAAASDALPAAPQPAPDPVLPVTASGGGTDNSSASSGSSGGSDEPAAPAPVVQLPEPQLPPAAPPANTGGTSTGGTDSGSTGSGGQAPAGGSDSPSIQLPLPQLPAPLVVDPAAN